MPQLVSKSSTGKIRVLDYNICYEDDHMVINRLSRQYGGKITVQPTLEIYEGKAGRTMEEQAELKYNALIKHALDKGYKLLKKPLDEYTEEQLYDIIGENITSAQGIPKPMLAKPYDKIKNIDIFDKEYYASTKIDGLRILLYMNDKGEIHTSSRGGSDYDNSMRDIINHPLLIQIFKDYPGLIMDGEGYHHHYNLAYINSMARKQVSETDYSFMQFYWYDIVDPSKTFDERLALINDIASKYGLSYNPEKHFNQDELRIQIVPHVPISGYDHIQSLHNIFVDDGWEGLVIRLHDSYYRPGVRSNDMIKWKMFTDDEFIVYGYQLGLRGTEDMVFKCLTHDNKEFLAKPIGTRELKDHYVRCFDELYKDHLATIKYFYYSDDGIPQLPVLKCFRLKEDYDG